MRCPEVLDEDDRVVGERTKAVPLHQELLVERDHEPGVIAQFVTGCEPIRMRLSVVPSGMRGGGWISAGMISTVQTPLPILAETAPKICPHLCAHSPESETISSVCSASVCIVGGHHEDVRIASHPRIRLVARQRNGPRQLRGGQRRASARPSH